jgi:hypothetical protein
VLNKNGQVMPNGSNFNLGTISNTYASSGSYNPIFKGATIIPFPKDTNKFYMFYCNLEYTLDNFGDFPSKLYYLVVDRTLDNGLGDVIIKDQVVINDTLNEGEIMAVKHGNGKDWWILCRKYNCGQFYSILVDSSGVHSPLMQSFPAPYHRKGYQVLNYIPNFSLDGEHLCYLYTPSNESYIELYDFNRCTGYVTNYKAFDWRKVHSNSWIRSCAFSPNGRYLYLSDLDSIWQTDLTAPNLVNSAIFLGLANPFSQLFLMKNAPDGQIYISHYGSWHKISVIQHPNNYGTACNYLLDTISFGSPPQSTGADGGIPNVPNLALGKIDCTIGIEEGISNQNELNIFPNPVTNQLTVVSNQLTVNTIEVTNILGQVCITPPCKGGKGDLLIDISTLPNGIYFIKATDEKGNVVNGKFVKE